MVDLKIMLPEGFLQEEERDGYVVSARMKQLWAVELDLLNEFDRVCKKHGLKYILDFGTLLGAIRHKGFIPWDDDVDVSILREDYDKLLKIGPSEFKDPYFLQTRKTDPGYDVSVAKLRRSDTTFIMTENIHHPMPYNQGIFIDIFVYDNLSSNKKEVVDKVGQESYRAYHNAFVLSHRPSLHDGFKLPFTLIRYFLYRMCYGSADKEFDRQEQLARTYDGPSDYVASIMFMRTWCRLRRWFEAVIDVPFEHLSMPVPAEYDAMLRDCYGDYMTPVRGSSAHSLVTFDVDRSYKEYLKK